MVEFGLEIGLPSVNALAFPFIGDGGGAVVFRGFERGGGRGQEFGDSGSEFLGEIELFFDPRTQLTEFGLGDLFLFRGLSEDGRAHREKQNEDGKTADTGFHFA